jgi:hypothetical protein
LAEGVTAAGFPSEGDEALDWWRRLRAVHAGDHRGAVSLPIT